MCNNCISDFLSTDRFKNNAPAVPKDAMRVLARLLKICMVCFDAGVRKGKAFSSEDLFDT